MSIPYLPGWWDEISKNATGLAQQLPQFIQPDRVANKKLQEMVQQNPMILEQMGNMDAGTRSLLEQSLGFQKQAPISQLPVGAQRQERELNQQLLNETMATPEGREEVRAGRTNTLTMRKRKAEELGLQNAELTLEGRIIDNKTGQIKLDQLQKESTRLEGILNKAAPELAPTARALAFGGNVSTEALQRIYADDTLRNAFQDYYKAFAFGREADLRKTLQSMRTPQERLMAVGWVEKELDNTRSQVLALRNKVRGREGFLTRMSDAGTYAADTTELTRLESRLKDLENTYADEVNKLGGKLPKNETQTAPVTPGPLANPQTRMPLNQLDNVLFKNP